MTSNRIGLCEPEIRGNEWKYVKECLDTGWVSSVGKFVERFERSVADYVGSKYAIACVNGTAALHVALLVAGVKPEQEVLVPALTFVAPANVVRYCGAWPTFIDVDLDYWQIDPQGLEDFLLKKCKKVGGKIINRVTERTVVAILPVHILGHPVDMAPILKMARSFKLKVIEDATEALGATYKGRRVGALSDVGVFSFNGNKIITTGGGGMIVTGDKRSADKVRYLTAQAKDDTIEYIHKEIGYNYRLNNIQSAMGVAQMELLEEFITVKKRIAERYTQGLKDVPGIRLPSIATWAKPNYWLYTILVDEKEYGQSSRALMKGLRTEGIEVRPLWHPLHNQKIFKGAYAHRISVANRLYRDALSLPSSVGLKIEDQDRIIQFIKQGRGKKGGNR